MRKQESNLISAKPDITWLFLASCERAHPKILHQTASCNPHHIQFLCIALPLFNMLLLEREKERKRAGVGE